MRQYATPHHADIYAGLFNIFLYSDIVDYQLLGDSYVPLLHCINVLDEGWHLPTLTYDKPHYTSLSKSIMDYIEILLAVFPTLVCMYTRDDARYMSYYMNQNGGESLGFIETSTQ